MTMIALILAIILWALAALHVYWGVGGVWPGTDVRSCARAIAGFRGIEAMPSMQAASAVAAALGFAGLLAFRLAGHGAGLLPANLALLGGTLAIVVFAGRGLAGYLPAWRRLTPEMPFARYDVRYYSPLCLVLGAGFAILTLQGATG